MANAKYRAERAGSEAQVGLLSEKLHGVALHLNGERFGIGIAQDLQFRHLQFGHLTASLGGFDDPLGSDGSTRCDSLFDCIIGRFSVDDQLQITQARAVIQCNELVVAKCPHPTLHQNFPSYLRFIAQIHNAFPLHNPRKLFAKLRYKETARTAAFSHFQTPLFRRASGRCGGRIRRCLLRVSPR